MPIGDIIFLLFIGMCIGWVAVLALRSKRRNAHVQSPE
jgi:hypothetical protein